MRKCVIIMNPESGKKRKITTYQEFYDILRNYGYETDIILTKARGDAEKIIQGLDNKIDLVIVAGGDGTLNEVVSGNLQRRKPLVVAPLPMGSTNDVGSMYGLDRSVYENLETILKGKRKKIDICYINDTPFVYVACLGDFVDMAYATPRELKKKYGKVAYLIYGAKQLLNSLTHYKIRFKIDDKEYEGVYSYIFISNSSRIAGQPDVYYNVKLDDNRFEVALANPKNKKELVKLLAKVDSMDVKDITEITYFQTNNFEIEFIDELKTSWCIDGEEYKNDTNKFVFRVEQNMKMQIPNANVGKLFADKR